MILLLAALAAGFSYPLGWSYAVPLALSVAWKGAGVGLLAIWASRQGRSTDHRLLAVVLLLGATADMVLEVHFIAGAALFAIGHVVAILLYRRHRRAERERAALWAIAFVAGAIALACHLAGPQWAAAVGVYTLFLAAMTAAAIGSQIPLAAAGALVFLLSDLLIFARLSGRIDFGWGGLAIWMLYFGGQALIAVGVARHLDKIRAAP